MDLERVWEDYHDRLRGFVARRVSDPAAADDIVQDVFLRTVEKRETLRSREKLRGWLYRIARNAIVDYYRARRPPEELPEALAAEPSAEEEQGRREIGGCLAAMVKGLPAPYREAVVLSEIEGRPQKEIADLQGLSLSGAKSRVQRGRAMLRDIILECCRVEFDSRGRAVAYEKRKEEGSCGRPEGCNDGRCLGEEIGEEISHAT